jgi:MarR family transcriptional regulator, organic hydroperoxide resistance regulator
MSKRSILVREIIDNLRRVFHLVNEQSKRAEHETGLTGPQLWAIKIIAQEAPIMVSDIARRMYLHPATVVGILNRLGKQGLVVRIRSAKDRRVVKVELTGQGEALIKKSPEVGQGLLVTGLEKLTYDKLKSIAWALEKMAEFLETQNTIPYNFLSPEVIKRGKATAGIVRGKSTMKRVGFSPGIFT